MSAATGTDSFALRTQLKRFRARAAVVLFGQSLLVAGGVSLLAAEALLLARFHDISLEETATVAIAAGLLLAVLATIIRMPSMRAAATHLDARLHLQDRIVTAVQYQDADDVFSRLVVRDAVDRLSAASPAKAFPFRIPRAMAVIPIVAVMPIAALAIPTTAMPGWRTIDTTGSSMTPGAAAATGAKAGELSAPRAATSPISVAAPAVTRRDTGSASESGTPGGSTRPTTAEPPQGDGVSASAAPRDASGSGRLPGGAARSAADDEASTGLGSGGSSSSREGRAGGAKDGGLAVDRPLSRPSLKLDDAYGSAYRAGRADAESAIARERIVPERRGYVRRYFAAIRPQDQR